MSRVLIRFWLALCLTHASSHAQVQITDVIPKALSNDLSQDSEPNLAVNPRNPLEIAISAFTPGLSFCDAALAPIFTSVDGGITWTLNCALPSAGWTDDISLRFGSNNRLYAAIVRRPDDALSVLRWDSIANERPMIPILVRKVDQPKIIDQPYITVADGADLLLVGENDLRNSPKTASVDLCPNGASKAPVFTLVSVEKRNPQVDEPSIRTAAHRDGTAYAAFISVRKWDPKSSLLTSDIVLVRRDPGRKHFDALTDPKDKFPGRKVAENRTIPWGCCIGQQRYGSHLSLAIDPRDSKKVYIAWADRTGDDIYTLHVRTSADAGQTWSQKDLWTVSEGINPALAVTDNGTVGFLYQRLDTSGPNQKWKTELARTTKPLLVLADTPANSPVKTFDPYLGDYLHLAAWKLKFFGVFSANNTPDPANFPAAIPRFNRNVDLKRHVLLATDGSTEIPASVDPFFFSVGSQ